jgi:cell division protein FtsN
VEKPGIYVLQAGSFSEYKDADRRRAELALHGIESVIQRVSIDDRTYHRVRIGPISDLNQLNMLRSRLHQANIDVIRIRLGD